MAIVTSRANCPLCIAETPGRHPDRGGTHSYYPSVSVDAVFSNADDTEPVTRTVTLELRDNGWLWMRGGPTGWESMQPGPERGRAWMACVGTPGSWKRCVVPAAEMDRALDELGVR